MGSKKLTKHPKEKFISPRVIQAVGMDLEESLLALSTDVTMTVLDTGHESYTYTTDSYWE